MTIKTESNIKLMTIVETTQFSNQNIRAVHFDSP